MSPMKKKDLTCKFGTETRNDLAAKTKRSF